MKRSLPSALDQNTLEFFLRVLGIREYNVNFLIPFLDDFFIRDINKYVVMEFFLKEYPMLFLLPARNKRDKVQMALDLAREEPNHEKWKAFKAYLGYML